MIENSIKSTGEVCSIVGIGINVNQKQFPEMSKASSLGVLLGKTLDKDEVLSVVLEELSSGFEMLQKEGGSQMWKTYKTFLFRKDKVSSFELPQGERFNGIIRDVTVYGKLVVEKEDGENVEFALKEIQLLY